MTIETWWSRLTSETRDWLIANNGSPVPTAVVKEVEQAGGPALSDPWWTTADDGSSEVLLPDIAVDWVEEIANGEPLTPS